MQGMQEASTVIEGKWLGSCNPGQKPGDVSIPGMPNMNLKDMMKARQRNLTSETPSHGCPCASSSRKLMPHYARRKL
jgi:hypothetical protein